MRSFKGDGTLLRFIFIAGKKAGKKGYRPLLSVPFYRPRHTPTIDYPPVKMVQFTGAAYTEGVEVVKRDQVKLKVYGVAKTIADCFKQRNKIGIDVALEALNDARAQQKVTANDLWHFAKVCRVANVMRP